MAPGLRPQRAWTGPDREIPAWVVGVQGSAEIPGMESPLGLSKQQPRMLQAEAGKVAAIRISEIWRTASDLMAA